LVGLIYQWQLTLLKEGSKNDKVDARKLSELLRAGLLRGVYHGENGLRSLQELARSYEVVSKDTMWVMNRIKALYRKRRGKPSCQAA
jgi:hypothetical protein